MIEFKETHGLSKNVIYCHIYKFKIFIENNLMGIISRIYDEVYLV